MTLNDIGAYRLFKYAVYAFLTINIGLFFHEEWNALSVRFTDGLILGDVMEAFASTIDTTAWVVLLLMFELETYVLDDRQLTRRVQLTLQLTRALCYVVIVSAFSGYVAKVMFLAQASPLAAVDGLCELANQGWSFAIDLDEYEPLSSANCGALASSLNLIQFLDLNVVVDQDGYRDLFRLAWVDVINSGTWLLVVTRCWNSTSGSRNTADWMGPLTQYPTPRRLCSMPFCSPPPCTGGSKATSSISGTLFFGWSPSYLSSET